MSNRNFDSSYLTRRQANKQIAKNVITKMRQDGTSSYGYLPTNYDSSIVNQIREGQSKTVFKGTTCTTEEPGCPCIGNTSTFVPADTTCSGIKTPSSLYNTIGHVAWATYVRGNSGPTLPGPRVFDIASDSQSNIYVVGSTGSTGGNIAIQNATPTAQIPSTNIFISPSTTDRPYLIKYNSAGQGVWAVSLVTGKSDSTTFSVAVDSFDNVYVTGKYFMTVTTQLQNAVLNPPVGGPSFTLSSVTMPPSFQPPPPAASTFGIFVTKYTKDGIAVWTTAFNGPTDADSGNGISVDSNNNVYITGNYSSTINVQLYNGLSTAPYQSLSPITLQSTGGINSMFLIKMNENGIIQWATTAYDMLNAGNNGIICDNCDNIIITGFYATNGSTPLTLGNATTTGQTPSSITLAASPGNSYIAKYNTNGQALWATYMGDASVTAGRGFSVAVDYNNNIYLTGLYSAPSQIDIYKASGNTQGIANITLPAADLAMYLVKYTTNGQSVWATYLGNKDESGRGVAIDGLNNVYVAGQYLGPQTLQNVNGSSQSSSGIVLPLPTPSDTPIAAFVVKYTTDGQAVWGAYLDSTTFADIANTVHIDPLTNRVYIGGQDKGLTSSPQIALNNASSLSYSPSGISLAAGAQQGFLVKYD
jgi:hypothetical protein